MTLAAATAQNLPMLRRFARALTGSQTSGDAYVMATLEAMAETAPPAPGEDLRVAAFTALIGMWRTVPLNRPTSIDPQPGGIMHAADRSLERMTPYARVAFLLHALEGFAPEQIAQIMQVDPREAAAWQEEAGREIADMISTEVLIIEDEPLIAMDLEALVTDMGHQVTEVARTHAEAVAAIEANPPGLVLADIHLADGSSGLDAVNEILQSLNLPVIFITAYPERLLTGERPEPTFLITKPFRAEVVTAIISQALFFDRRAGATADLVEVD